MKKCMDSDEMPPVGDHIMGGECEFCAYARERAKLTVKAMKDAMQEKKAKQPKS